MFILSSARIMIPKICMASDYVVEVGDIADEMYFIKNGLIEIQATDNSTVIAYMSEGSFFGKLVFCYWTLGHDQSKRKQYEYFM